MMSRHVSAAEELLNNRNVVGQWGDETAGPKLTVVQAEHPRYDE